MDIAVSVWNDRVAPDEAHVHQPTNALTISENEHPDNNGIRCGICNMPMPMTQDEWHRFINFWVFGRGI